RVRPTHMPPLLSKDGIFWCSVVNLLCGLGSGVELGATVFAGFFSDADGVTLADADGEGLAMASSTRFMRLLNASNIAALLLRTATMPPCTMIKTAPMVSNAQIILVA